MFRISIWNPICSSSYRDINFEIFREPRWKILSDLHLSSHAILWSAIRTIRNPTYLSKVSRSIISQLNNASDRRQIYTTRHFFRYSFTAYLLFRLYNRIRLGNFTTMDRKNPKKGCHWHWLKEWMDIFVSLLNLRLSVIHNCECDDIGVYARSLRTLCSWNGYLYIK